MTDRVCIGAIELINKKDESQLFSEPDLMMLKTLASAAALAIRNARMADGIKPPGCRDMLPSDWSPK